MPVLNTTVFRLNDKFNPANVRKTTDSVRLFEQGNRLDAGFVFPSEPQLRIILQNYLDRMPRSIHESLRAVMREALVSDPPTPVVFNWEAAYDWSVNITHTPDTVMTPGVITVTLRGRYPGDDHPLSEEILDYARSRGAASSSKGARKPAKRKASKRS